jgi:hypothetical protein
VTMPCEVIMAQPATVDTAHARCEDCPKSQCPRRSDREKRLRERGVLQDCAFTAWLRVFDKFIAKKPVAGDVSASLDVWEQFCLGAPGRDCSTARS